MLLILIICYFGSDKDNFQKQLYPSVVYVILPTYVVLFGTMWVAKDKPDDSLFFAAMRCVCLASVTGLNIFKEVSLGSDIPGMLMMIIYYMLFFAHGVVDHFNTHQYNALYAKFAKTELIPLAAFGFYTAMGVFSPHVSEDVGFLFYYPFYDNFSMRTVFTTGTFYWLFVTRLLGEAFCNDLSSEKSKVYRVIVGTSMYNYLSHYFFIAFLAYFVIPKSMGFGMALFLLITVS